VAQYDAVADDYEQRIVPRFRPVAEALAAVAAVPPGAVVVEVGAGTGGLTRLLCRDAVIVATDVSVRSLGIARNVAACDVVVGDQASLPVRSGAADYVVAQFTMLLDSPPALGEARRALRPGGVLAVAAWRDDYTEFDVLSQARVDAGLGPIPPYDEAAHAARLREAGFTELRFDALRLTNTWADADDYLAYRAAFGVAPVEPDVWDRYCNSIERAARAMHEVTFTWSVVLATAVAAAR
jgi:SAM-dependent methyltransferase